MVTYTHNHAPEILLWQCSCHRNKKNSFKLQKSFFNYDANLTSVIAMELKFFFSLRCWFLCMMSLALTSAILKTSVKFWGTSFKFWLCPWFGKRYVSPEKIFVFKYSETIFHLVFMWNIYIHKKRAPRTYLGAFFGHPYHSNGTKIHLDAAL